MESGDHKYLWAAYRLGNLDAVTEDIEGMSQADFTAFVGLAFGDAKVFVARRGGEMSPVGIMLAADIGDWIEPKALWFSWATPRNIIESMVSFIHGSDKDLVFYGNDQEEKWWTRMGQYGVVRKVGRFFLRNNKRIYIWQKK